MATTIVTKSGSGAPTASDLVAGELAVDLTNKRLYTEDSGGTVLEVGSNPYNFTANHDGSAKLATTATGIDVTGTVTADGLTVDGSSTFDDILLTAVALPSAGNPSIALRNTDNNIYIQAGSGNAITFLDSSQNTMLSATPTSHSLQISNGNAFAIDSNRDISFYNAAGTSQSFFWDASAEALGIGTTTPSQLLEISGATAPAIRLTDTTYNQYAEISTANAGSLILKADVGNGGTGSTYIGFEVDATERMRIDSSGNVNIYGTDNRPLAITSFATASAGAGWDLDATSSNGAVTVSTGGTEAMRIDSSGNLLVGLSSGQAALIHAQAPKATYTDYATVFAGGTDSHNGDHAISLMTAGNSLSGIIGSNLSIDGSTFSQPETARSSGYISFSNNTTAGKTSIITFGGLTKGTATALPKMTLDGDGNLLVGRTSSSGLDVDGHVLFGGGGSYISNTDSGVQFVNRNGVDDGALTSYYKNGVAVGSIGITSGDLTISSSASSHAGLRFSNANILPLKDGALSAGGIDLGQSSGNYGFKDLYLSGGVVFGTTGGSVSSKTLDDYEEGTFTPSFTLWNW